MRVALVAGLPAFAARRFVDPKKGRGGLFGLAAACAAGSRGASVVREVS